MGYLIPLQVLEGIEQEVDYLDQIRFVEPAPLRAVLADQVLQVHLRAVHHDVGVLAAGVLVDFLLRHEVPVVADQVFAQGRKLLHGGDLPQEALVLVVSLDLNLL